MIPACKIMNPIRFHLPVIPSKSTSQGAGKRMVIVKGKPIFFKNKANAQNEYDLLVLLSPYIPPEPITGPIALSVDFAWPWRKSEPLWRQVLNRVWHTSKPDCSNIVKQIEDCMTKLNFWNDDGQIASLTITKAWGDQIGISVEIRQLQDPPRKAAKKPAKSDQTPTFL